MEVAASSSRANSNNKNGDDERLTFDDFVNMVECFDCSAQHTGHPVTTVGTSSSKGSSSGSSASVAQEMARQEHLKAAFDLVLAAEFMGERYFTDKIRMDRARDAHVAKLEEVFK